MRSRRGKSRVLRATGAVGARERQKDPAWVADYRATRPKIERKLGHLMRRKHGGRRARVRGRVKVDADFNLLAAAGQPRPAGRVGSPGSQAGVSPLLRTVRDDPDDNEDA